MLAADRVFLEGLLLQALTDIFEADAALTPEQAHDKLPRPSRSRFKVGDVTAGLEHIARRDPEIERWRGGTYRCRR